MASQIRANKLMTKNFHQLDENVFLKDAIEYINKQEESKAIVVIDKEKNYAGILKPLQIFKTLLFHVSIVHQKKNEQNYNKKLHEEILSQIDKEKERKIGDLMLKDVPTIYKTDSLGQIILRVREYDLDFIPVLDKKKVIGIIKITTILQKTSEIALSEESKGIEL